MTCPARRTYHGLGIAYQSAATLLGKAIEYTHKALALYALEHDADLQANGQNELGLLLMRQGQMERAEEAFRAALAYMGEAGSERMKSHYLLSLGELQLKTGRAAEGIRVAKEAIDLAKRLDEHLAVASGHALLGQLYEHIDDHALADKEFRLAIRLLSAEGRTDRLAETHAAYAEPRRTRRGRRSHTWPAGSGSRRPNCPPAAVAWRRQVLPAPSSGVLARVTSSPCFTGRDNDLRA